MKMIFKMIVTFLMLAFVATRVAFGQQLPQFTQYIFNGLHVNPGYAGYKGEPYFQSTYRSQWISFPGAPQTFTVTVDLSANEGTMGFGISLLNDKQGPARTTTGMLTYAYRIQVGQKSFLGLGATFGASEYMIDRDQLDPNDQDDPEIMGGMVNSFTPNLNTGLFSTIKNFSLDLAYTIWSGKMLWKKKTWLWLTMTFIIT